jgi:hypothetical protein
MDGWMDKWVDRWMMGGRKEGSTSVCIGGDNEWMDR